MDNGMGTQRPPLGLRPKYIVDSERVEEISEAIKRYIDYKIPIPYNWLKEYNNLSESIKQKLT